ncbi:unnamed protein product [Lathyrus oleraceus]
MILMNHFTQPKMYKDELTGYIQRKWRLSPYKFLRFSTKTSNTSNGNGKVVIVAKKEDKMNVDKDSSDSSEENDSDEGSEDEPSKTPHKKG